MTYAPRPGTSMRTADPMIHETGAFKSCPFNRSSIPLSESCGGEGTYETDVPAGLGEGPATGRKTSYTFSPVAGFDRVSRVTTSPIFTDRNSRTADTVGMGPPLPV